MGFFESQGAINKRLFKTSRRAMMELFVESIEDMQDLTVHNAFLIGGWTTALSVVQQCQCVKEFWDKGDSIKASNLLKLFTLHMVSWWYMSLDKHIKQTQKRKKEAREILTSNILTLWGDDTRQSVDDYMNLDMQLKWEIDNKRMLINLSCLLLARACEACGQPCVHWNKVKFPVEFIEDLTASGAIINHRPFGSPVDSVLLPVCIAAGVDQMFKWYSSVAEKLEERIG